MKKTKEAPVVVGSGGRTEAGSGVTGMLMRCPKMYQYAEVRGIHIPQVQTPPHFAIGLLFAAMRRQWFSQKFDSSEAAWLEIKRACQREKEAQKLPIDGKDELYATALMSAYVEHWLKLPRPRPVAAEYKLGPIPIKKGGGKALYRTARLDDLSYYPEAGGALCIGEAKTTGGDIGSLVREYELHIQPLQYYALYQLSKRGEARFGPIKGVVLDVVQKMYDGKKPKFARVFVEVRPEVIASFQDSAAYYAEMASRIEWDTPVMRSYQCTYMAGRAKVDCTYKDLCRFGPSAIGKYVMKDGRSLREFKPEPGKSVAPWL